MRVLELTPHIFGVLYCAYSKEENEKKTSRESREHTDQHISCSRRGGQPFTGSHFGVRPVSSTILLHPEGEVCMLSIYLVWQGGEVTSVFRQADILTLDGTKNRSDTTSVALKRRE